MFVELQSFVLLVLAASRVEAVALCVEQVSGGRLAKEGQSLSVPPPACRGRSSIAALSVVADEGLNNHSRRRTGPLLFLLLFLFVCFRQIESSHHASNTRGEH